jgi:hypothetical protein
MAYKTLEAEHDGLKFRIEEDNPEVGVYLYVLKNGTCIKDYLQDNIETCKMVALEEYKVPVSIWQEVQAS